MGCLEPAQLFQASGLLASSRSHSFSVSKCCWTLSASRSIDASRAPRKFVWWRACSTAQRSRVAQAASWSNRPCTYHIGVVDGQPCTDVAQLFFRFEMGLQVEKSQPINAPRSAFEPDRVVHSAPQHLKAAADADELATVAQMPLNGLLPALFTQPGEIGAHALGAGQDYTVANAWRERPL